MNKTTITSLVMLILLCFTAQAQHFNGTILEQNYNLTPLMSVGSDSAIDNPPLWIANWNQQLNNIGIVTFLYVFSALLFLIIRLKPEVKDSEAALYAGFAGTIIGVLLFVIDLTALPGYKLITWTQLLPLILITAFAIILNYVNRNY